MLGWKGLSCVSRDVPAVLKPDLKQENYSRIRRNNK